MDVEGLGVAENIRAVTLPPHDYFEAWRKLCVKYNEIAGGASGGLTGCTAYEFFWLFEELRIIHGDPTKSIPLGVMDVADRRKPATDGIGGRREGDVNDVGMMLYRSEF